MTYLAVLFASLAGSPHCAGMCGGFVALYSAHRPRSMRPHLAYNLGRLLAYVSLGSLFGYFGRALEHGGALIGLQHSASTILCILMIVWGIALWRGASLHATHTGAISSLLGRLYQPLFRYASGMRPEFLALALGLLSALLPCGWLFLFLTAAAGTASPLHGAGLMFVFWLGTVPMLLSLGRLSEYLSVPLRRALPRISAVLLIMTALVSLNQHTGMFSLSKAAPSHCHMPEGE